MLYPDHEGRPSRDSDNEVRAGHRADARLGLTGSDLLSADNWLAIMRRFGLSSRELQIVQSVFDNIKDPEIGRRLGISVHTVRTHIERLHRKLGVWNRPGVILSVLDCHLRQREAMKFDSSPSGTNKQAG